MAGLSPSQGTAAFWVGRRAIIPKNGSIEWAKGRANDPQKRHSFWGPRMDGRFFPARPRIRLAKGPARAADLSRPRWSLLDCPRRRPVRKLVRVRSFTHRAQIGSLGSPEIASRGPRHCYPLSGQQGLSKKWSQDAPVVPEMTFSSLNDSWPSIRSPNIGTQPARRPTDDRAGPASSVALRPRGADPPQGRGKTRLRGHRL